MKLSGLALRAAAAPLALVTAVACGGPARPPEVAGGAPSGTGAVRFVDVTAEAGIDFRHRHCGTGERYFPETMGSGGGFLDYDGDGLVDLYLVNNAPTPGYRGPRPQSALYRNLGDGRFAEVTARAGVGDPGYAMGVSFGDYDRDGDTDLYVTAFGPNRLYVNQGDGTFREAGRAAGVAGQSWSASAAFADYDGDGDLDLYVANYVDFDYERHTVCGDSRLGILTYCHPDVYDGVADTLYRNDGDGTFSDVGAALLHKPAEQWRLEGKGLGVVWGDYNGDGRDDLYVANDSTANFLWENRGEEGFEDVALLAGVAFDESGKAEAGMGVDMGDVDNDGQPDLFVTNLDLETNTLYRNRGDGFFVDVTAAAGVATPGFPLVGFGTRLLDYDNDGWLDLVIVDGHIIDNIAEVRPDQTHAQPAQVFHNLGQGRFAEVCATVAPALARPRVSRGLASADIDRDGDLDLLVTRNDDAAALLRNDGGNERHWLRLALRGTLSNGDGYGTRVTLPGPGGRRVAEQRSSSSFLSQSEPWLQLGLGDATRVERLEVSWPSGLAQRFAGLPADRELVLFEPTREGR